MKNPLIIDRGITSLISEESFGGENYPDFVGILNNGNHLIIEIESPTKKLYTKKGCPSAKFTQAEQQVRDYLQWMYQNKDYLNRRKLPKITPENTKGLLIIGLRSNMSEKEQQKLSQQNYSVRGTHEIKTFDDIFNENLQTIESIRKV